MRENVVGVVPLWPVLLNRDDRHPYLIDPGEKLRLREGIFHNELDEFGDIGLYVRGRLRYYTREYNDASLVIGIGRSGFAGIIELNGKEKYDEYGPLDGHTVIEIVAFCRSHPIDQRRNGIITEKMMQQQHILDRERHDEHIDSGVLLFDSEGFFLPRCDRQIDFGADDPPCGSFKIEYENQRGVRQSGSTLTFKSKRP